MPKKFKPVVLEPTTFDRPHGFDAPSLGLRAGPANRFAAWPEVSSSLTNSHPLLAASSAPCRKIGAFLASATELDCRRRSSYCFYLAGTCRLTSARALGPIGAVGVYDVLQG